MKTLICWFPALRVGGGLRFIPPPGHREAWVLWGGCWRQREKEGKKGVWGRVRALEGSAPAAVGADSEVPISSRFRDSEMS